MYSPNSGKEHICSQMIHPMSAVSLYSPMQVLGLAIDRAHTLNLVRGYCSAFACH